MAEFGIKTLAQLKALYLDALVESGQAKGIAVGRGARQVGKKFNEIVVNKRGSLVIPRETAEEIGLLEGDVFIVRRTKSGVSLKKVSPFV